MTLLRMDNVLIVVEDMDTAIDFFVGLGMELEGRTPVEGPAVERLIALEGVRAEIASLRTPDGHGRLELDKYHAPPAVGDVRERLPVNALGIRRIMFASRTSTGSSRGSRPAAGSSSAMSRSTATRTDSAICGGRRAS